MRRMPSNAEEAVQAAEAIASGTPGKWGSACLWPEVWVKSGDWTPAQWFDGGLVTVVKAIENSDRLQPMERLARLGPPGQGVQGAFEISEVWEEGCVPGFHSVSSKLRTTLEGEPDVWYRPRLGKERLAQRHWQKRSHLLIAMRHNTVSGRLTATWSPVASLGWWVPVGVHDQDQSKALTVWWNSTPTKLMLFNRRAKTLTYPMWQVAHLREIRVPKLDCPGWDALRAAYELVRHEEILPMKQAMEDPAREIIDAAAAEVLGVGEAVVADWRLRMSREPTVTNRPAPE